MQPPPRTLAAPAQPTAWSRRLQRQRGHFSLPLFTQELLALLEAGLGLSEALEALGEREQAAGVRGVIEALLGRLREGLRLSDAVAAQPAHFPPLYVGLLRAAEHTSDLPRALARYLDYRSRVDQLRARIVSATLYPAILCGVGLAVMLFLMLYVVPSFAEVYQDSGRRMPWVSRALMLAGQWLHAHGLAALAMAAAAAWWGRQRLRRLGPQGGLLAVLARLPGLREHAHLIEMARLYLTLGMLLEGGIAIVPALEMVAPSVGPAAQVRLRRAARDVSHGLPVSQALASHGLDTLVALRMMCVGERSGQLGAMLTRAAHFHDGETQRFIERFSKVFEPALMAAIGVLIGVIVVLLYLPIFDLAGSLQ